MNVTIVTDAWEPQVNGVVRTLQSVRGELERMGDRVSVIAPDQFLSVPCPTYPEIRLAVAGAGTVGRMIETTAPEALHISTEGPLGIAARRWCLRRGLPFTTAYHTQFPEYVAARTGVPAEWTWHWMRWFHAPSAAVLVSTATVRRSLQAHGIAHTRHWGRGVDLDRFRPSAGPSPLFEGLARPIQLFVGRVAIEKNIEAFLETRQPGTRVVVGDGPARAALAQRYPDAVFLGALAGEALASAYAGADVFVFPSRTDTFGLVMIEALASGTPVAAYPVAGPVDVLDPAISCLDEDLDLAISGALKRDRRACTDYGRLFSWAASAGQFREALVTFDRARQAA